MKNGKLFSRFSVIDAIVLVIVILLGVVICVRLGFFKTPEKIQEKEVETYEKQDFYLTIVFDNIPKKIRDEILKPGESIYQSSKKIGTIDSVEKATMRSTTTLDDGSVIMVDMPATNTYTIKVKANLMNKDNYWRAASNMTVAVGRTAYFYTKYFGGSGTITGVEKIQ